MSRHLRSLLADIFVPYRRVFCDETFQQFPARRTVQIDDFHAVLAQPVKTTGKRSAFSYNESADLELSHQPATVPARCKRRYHDKITIAALAARPAKRIGLPVDTRVTLLYAPVVAAAH